MGLKTRYDGKVIKSEALQDRIADGICYPVCPEQLGGLPTPRTPADLVGGDGYDVLAGKARVVTRDDRDVTRSFVLGAEQVLLIARLYDVERIFLKSGSPSCGFGATIGVTAALLESEGFVIVELD
jgi:uncharacterized protein YbbK (DUF523 family)